jgi:hypothetical protein
MTRYSSCSSILLKERYSQVFWRKKREEYKDLIIKLRVEVLENKLSKASQKNQSAAQAWTTIL